MKRPAYHSIVTRLAALALILTCAVIAAAPQARGSGPTVAVTAFNNDARAPKATVDALGQALYEAVDQSGKYTAVGGGPLVVQSAVGGDLLVNDLDQARKVGAEEIISADLLSASGGSVTYRLSAYRVDPLAFIRSQTFTQSSLTPASLRAGFVTDLAALHAPRTAAGTIYSITDGVKADFGEATGAHLGDVYNVVRNSQKVAQAKVTVVNLNSADIEIINAAPGYKPAIGDQLVGVGPLPPIPPAAHTGANTFSIIGLLAATGAALWAIGHHGEPAGAAPAPSPTSSGIGGFSVNSTSPTGTPPGTVTFTFTFSQPVNTAGVTFVTNTFASVQVVRGAGGLPAGTPITVLGGPTPAFSSANTVLIVNATTLLPGDKVIFTFNPTITSILGVALTTTNITFLLSAAHHPIPQSHLKNHPDGGVLNPPSQGGVLSPPSQGGALTPTHGKDPKNPK